MSGRPDDEEKAGCSKDGTVCAADEQVIDDVTSEPRAPAEAETMITVPNIDSEDEGDNKKSKLHFFNVDRYTHIGPSNPTLCGVVVGFLLTSMGIATAGMMLTIYTGPPCLHISKHIELEAIRVIETLQMAPLYCPSNWSARIWSKELLNCTLEGSIDHQPPSTLVLFQPDKRSSLIFSRDTAVSWHRGCCLRVRHQNQSEAYHLGDPVMCSGAVAVTRIMAGRRAIVERVFSRQSRTDYALLSFTPKSENP